MGNVHLWHMNYFSQKMQNAKNANRPDEARIYEKLIKAEEWELKFPSKVVYRLTPLGYIFSPDLLRTDYRKLEIGITAKGTGKGRVVSNGNKIGQRGHAMKIDKNMLDSYAFPVWTDMLNTGKGKLKCEIQWDLRPISTKAVQKALIYLGENQGTNDRFKRLTNWPRTEPLVETAKLPSDYYDIKELNESAAELIIAGLRNYGALNNGSAKGRTIYEIYFAIPSAEKIKIKNGSVVIERDDNDIFYFFYILPEDEGRINSDPKELLKIIEENGDNIAEQRLQKRKEWWERWEENR